MNELLHEARCSIISSEWQVIGTDRNVNQSLLEQRADILNSLIKLFHNNLQSISDEMSIGYQGKTTLPERLFYIFETFLPMLTYRGNVFRHMPIAKLPKVSARFYLAFNCVFYRTCSHILLIIIHPI